MNLYSQVPRIGDTHQSLSEIAYLSARQKQMAVRCVGVKHQCSRVIVKGINDVLVQVWKWSLLDFEGVCESMIGLV